MQSLLSKTTLNTKTIIMEKRTDYALITGGATGIGLVIAKLLAERGYNILLVSRNKECLHVACTMLQEEYGVDAFYIAKDLSLPGAAEEVYKEIKEGVIAMDVTVLVNNAGFGTVGDFLDVPLEQVTSMVMLQTVTLTQLSHLFGNDMKEKGEGYILNVSSAAGFTGIPGEVEYAATKAFGTTFSIGLYKELRATGVHVTALIPGGVRGTDFMESMGATNTRLFNEWAPLMLSDVEHVAKTGVEALFAGKSSAIPGIQNRFLNLLARVLPRDVSSEIGKFFLENRK